MRAVAQIVFDFACHQVGGIGVEPNASVPIELGERIQKAHKPNLNEIFDRLKTGKSSRNTLHHGRILHDDEVLQILSRILQVPKHERLRVLIPLI